MNRFELKTNAKAQIRGNLGILFLISLLIGLISCIPIVGIILAPALSISVCIIYLNLTRGSKPQVGDVFSGLNLLGKSWWLYILISFFTSLWSLLLWIPGIYKAITYSMAPFILAEHPDLTAREALNESKRITRGHAWELFVLELSFIGWVLLSMIPLVGTVIMAVYVVPYMSATYANAYQSLKGTGAITVEF